MSVLVCTLSPKNHGFSWKNGKDNESIGDTPIFHQKKTTRLWEEFGIRNMSWFFQQGCCFTKKLPMKFMICS